MILALRIIFYYDNSPVLNIAILRIVLFYQMQH